MVIVNAWTDLNFNDKALFKAIENRLYTLINDLKIDEMGSILRCFTQPEHSTLVKSIIRRILEFDDNNNRRFIDSFEKENLSNIYKAIVNFQIFVDSVNGPLERQLLAAELSPKDLSVIAMALCRLNIWSENLNIRINQAVKKSCINNEDLVNSYDIGLYSKYYCQLNQLPSDWLYFFIFFAKRQNSFLFESFTWLLKLTTKISSQRSEDHDVAEGISLLMIKSIPENMIGSEMNLLYSAVSSLFELSLKYDSEIFHETNVLLMKYIIQRLQDRKDQLPPNWASSIIKNQTDKTIISELIDLIPMDVISINDASDVLLHISCNGHQRIDILNQLIDKYFSKPPPPEKSSSWPTPKHEWVDIVPETFLAPPGVTIKILQICANMNFNNKIFLNNVNFSFLDKMWLTELTTPLLIEVLYSFALLRCPMSISLDAINNINQRIIDHLMDTENNLFQKISKLNEKLIKKLIIFNKSFNLFRNDEKNRLTENSQLFLDTIKKLFDENQRIIDRSSDKYLSVDNLNQYTGYNLKIISNLVNQTKKLTINVPVFGGAYEADVLLEDEFGKKKLVLLDSSDNYYFNKNAENSKWGLKKELLQSEYSTKVLRDCEI
eukprot:GHVL01043457.1.p1 GENE.GHVL01043457.1~~GHVL01043457.1.p1  ORF type:complete len:621 (-),score=152.90 GHVL01043457.1:223-2043(-)